MSASERKADLAASTSSGAASAGNAVGGCAPLEIVRSSIRFSLQPIDAPPDLQALNRLFDHMQSDELLLFSTDYPHWQFEGDAALPEGLSSDHDR
jgi:hypothetical protein